MRGRQNCCEHQVTKTSLTGSSKSTRTGNWLDCPGLSRFVSYCCCRCCCCYLRRLLYLRGAFIIVRGKEWNHESWRNWLGILLAPISSALQGIDSSDSTLHSLQHLDKAATDSVSTLDEEGEDDADSGKESTCPCGSYSRVSEIMPIPGPLSNSPATSLSLLMYIKL